MNGLFSGSFKTAVIGGICLVLLGVFITQILGIAWVFLANAIVYAIIGVGLYWLCVRLNLRFIDVRVWRIVASVGIGFFVTMIFSHQMMLGKLVLWVWNAAVLYLVLHFCTDIWPNRDHIIQRARGLATGEDTDYAGALREARDAVSGSTERGIKGVREEFERFRKPPPSAA